MSLLNALLSRSDPEERAIGPSQVAWDRGDMNATYGPGGVQVDRDSILGLSAVWACVSLIADSIATLPLGVFKTVGGASQATTSPRWLDEPNPEQTRIDFIFGCVASLLLHGNAYIYTIRDAKQNIVEAWMLDPRWVYVRREQQPNGRLGLTYYIEVGAGMQSPVGPFRVPAGPDMFHIMAFQPNSSWPMGISPIEKQMMFAGALAGQEMGTRWFSQGFNASGVIEIADDMDIDQAREIKADFKDANTGGPRKMHYPPILTGGATWKQIQISPEQAQFLQQRQFATDEIARWFRVPPHMIGNLEKTTSWGSGIEEQSLGFVKYTLRPWLERIEASWTRNMLSFQPGAFFRFETKALERGNMVTQADFFTKIHGVGGITANEMRAEIGLPPFDGGDTHYFMVNTAPVGTEPITIDKPKATDVPPVEQNSRPMVEVVVPGLSEDDKNGLAETMRRELAPDLAERDARSERLASAVVAASDAAATAAGSAVIAARAAEESGLAIGDVRKQIAAEMGDVRSEVSSAQEMTADELGKLTAELGDVRSDVAEGVAAVQEFTANEMEGVRKQIKAIEDAAEKSARADKQPKLRSVTLPDGRKAKLLVDGDSRILETEDGKRIVVETENLSG